MSTRITKHGSFEISSDADEVNALLNRLENILESSCLDELSAFQLRCAVVEAVNNCIQHAYFFESGQPIVISYRLEPERVEITVSDRGRVFDSQIMAPAATPTDESGRGMEIIRAWVSALRFTRADGWNTCCLEQHKPVRNSEGN